MVFAKKLMAKKHLTPTETITFNNNPAKSKQTEQLV